MKIRTSIFCFLLIFACAGILLSRLDSQAVSDTVHSWTVVVDAGHGGNDPGKVGVNDALEKDINLKIALYLREYLTQEGIRVVMTRNHGYGAVFGGFH